MRIILLGFVASLAAGLATGVGALPCLFFRRVSERWLHTMLGFAAGVMLAATSFSLIIPAIDIGTDQMEWSALRTVVVVLAGILAGGGFIDRAAAWLPHEHFFTGREGPDIALRRIWLFVIAITIHNFPEGLAVGVGFGSGDLRSALTLATGIALQNMPEGLAVAMPLMALGYGRWRALWIATATGLVEPVGGLLGATAVAYFRPVLPFAMGFAAGAMLFVISDEIIPETHSKAHARIATFGVLIGFVVMTGMDILLG